MLSSIFLAGCTLPGQSEKLSALQISSLPKTTVFLDNKHVGRTPYYDEKLKPGEYILKLLPEEEGTKAASWTGKIKLTPETLTVVNWQFGQTDGSSEGEILSLEKIDSTSPEMAVISNPDGSQVKIDNEQKGITPLIIKSLSEGDHEVTVLKDGYNQRLVRSKTVAGYRLNINVQLSKPEISTTSAEKDNGTKIASESGKMKAVVVKETPTGWLRVREGPSLGASESGKVNTGEQFTYLDEKEGWIKIEFQKGKTGWVSSQYIEIK